VFSIPGVFTGMKRGIAAGDFDLLFALTAVAAGFVAVAGLLADLALNWLDPRMRDHA
jgi:ABC-type dipeptide/oligopeptide/nickel transport system permease component